MPQNGRKYFLLKYKDKKKLRNILDINSNIILQRYNSIVVALLITKILTRPVRGQTNPTIPTPI